jgi:hypothetical protein
MTLQKTLTISEYRARVLLSAWNSASLARIEEATAEASLSSNGFDGSFEAERAEMIQEIAATIRLWMDGGTSRADLDCSIGLLQHLAGLPVASAPRQSGRVVSQPRKESPVFVVGKLRYEFGSCSI